MRPSKPVCCSRAPGGRLCGPVPLLMLAPSALAHKHPSPSGRCTSNINVAPAQITAGDSVVVFGRLRCHRRRDARRQDREAARAMSPARPASALVQTHETETLGFYELTVTDVQIQQRLYVSEPRRGERSPSVSAFARTSRLQGPPEGTQLLTGGAHKVTFTGTVSPADVGALVVLQRQNALTGNEWHRIDFGFVQSGGSFSIMHTFRVPGDANLRVIVRSQRRNSPSPSTVLSYEISQAQNPKLTISASPDPIPYGQSVTISGTDAAGAGQRVTLLAHTASQGELCSGRRK